MAEKDMIVIAVTGGMGSGQSTVCKFLAKMGGVKIINADFEAKKEIEKNPEVRKELKSAFGSRVFYRNGKLNRKLLARMAFTDEARTNRLNRIVHPQMVSRVLDLIEEARESETYKIVAVDAALIYELNLEHMFDAIVVVMSSMRNRMQRIKGRDKLTEKEITDRISKQIPLEEKRKWGDYVIVNNGSLEALQRKTWGVYKKLKQLLERIKKVEAVG
jgi:dephospho-CoA kinase